MRLRTNVRRTKTSGAKMYAYCEDIAKGHATVRIATNGARLTNLPIHGTVPELNEKVIVDYSSEGQPYVRKITAQTNVRDPILQNETWRRDLEPAINEIIDNNYVPEIGYEACQLTMGPTSFSQVFNLAPASYKYKFDTVVFDTSNGSMPQITEVDMYNRRGIRGPGVFLCSWVIGFDGHPYDGSAYVDAGLTIRGYYTFGQRWAKWGYPSAGRQYLSGTSVVPVWDTSVIELYYGPWLMFSSPLYPVIRTVLPVPAEPPLYPKLTAWKISSNLPTYGERSWQPYYWELPPFSAWGGV